ncbi:FAD/NAD(P)-binding domain-containing protein [Aspergillus taichungensis]|uniref:FAD/NAD(P)-binding domain-containing protein n=1 Tax=Aspergillus taichungensis TaxID=482145 RepID=A0A2J5HK66_9EURO|nr:FAD/NAD(P)-binding domain-containing protein [Aspergillus taichungensis]
MHVLIVGGGLGGLSLAQCLRKQGISFEIFERDESAHSRFQGWAIAIHSIIDQITASFPSDMPNLKEATNHLAPLDLPAQIGLYYPNREGRLGVQDSPELPIIRAERRRLREWLSTNLPIQWGKRVAKIEHNDDGVCVFFEDGTSAKGDVLVGADGIKSVVREHLIQRPSDEVLKLVPLAAIVGEVDMSGEAFKRQLALGHSAYIYISPDLGFWNFGGLHHVNADGVSGRHYWMYMEPDANVAEPDHWLQKASQAEKHEYVMQKVSKLPLKFREIFESTPASGIKPEPHIWRDLELESLPAGRVILMGDAAHAMTPFRGEGGYHTFIDALQLSKILGKVDSSDLGALKSAVAEYNEEMLERGVEAVRNSRNEQGARKAQDKKSKVVSALQEAKPIPESEIVLEVNA